MGGGRVTHRRAYKAGGLLAEIFNSWNLGLDCGSKCWADQHQIQERLEPYTFLLLPSKQHPYLPGRHGFGPNGGDLNGNIVFQHMTTEGVLRVPRLLMPPTPYSLRPTNNAVVIDRRVYPHGLVRGCGRSNVPRLVHLVSYKETDKLTSGHKQRLMELVNFLQHHTVTGRPERIILDYGKSGMKNIVNSIGEPEDVTAYNVINPHTYHDVRSILDITWPARAEGGLYLGMVVMILP